MKRCDRIKHWRGLSIGLGLLLTLPGCKVPAYWSITDRDSPINVSRATTQHPLPAQSPSAAEMEAQVRQQINQIRQEQGLSELRPNEKLAEVARRYSQRMASQNFFSHTSPDGDSSADRVQSAGILYWMVGENLFKGVNVAQPVSVAVQGWMDSPGHKANILQPTYRETGVGVWRVGNTYYFTQLFLRSLAP